MIDFHFDFETRSELDLLKVGGVRYATHPSTEATLITWCFGRTGAVKAWRYGQLIPADLIDVMNNPEKYRFNAANVEFDYMIWTVPFARQVTAQAIIKRPPLKNIIDTLALTKQFRVGSSLEKAAQILDIPVSKDKEGRRLMLKQCKPLTKTGKFYELTPDEWTAFERYGLIDTVMLREIYYKVPQLTTTEQWINDWTFKRNLTGIRIDVDLLGEMNKIVEHYMPMFEQEFMQITGLKVRSPKCKDWFKPYFPWIENMQADTVRDMAIDKHKVPPIAQRALEIKQLAGSTSVSKVRCAVKMEHQGRIYGLLEYHKAQTKRFAGRGIQIHNFPRPEHTPKDALPQLDVHDLASHVRAAAPILVDPIGYVKNLLRRIWLPNTSDVLYCGDFSKVEPTVLRWLTDMGPISPTAYEEMAVEIYTKPLELIGKDSEERQVGKAAVLGGGYGMGHKKFKSDTYSKTGIVMDLKFSKHVIDTYRKTNKPIVDFWRDLQKAFRLAILGQGTRLCNGKIYVMPMDQPWKGVQIRLPSGSHLYYHKTHLKQEVEEIEIVEVVNNMPVVRKGSRVSENIYYVTDKEGRVQSTKIYGGLLTEHVTSAIARDLLTFAMYNLDNSGFEMLTTIHDECWGSAGPNRTDEFKETMCILPYWARDIELSASTDCGVRYLK